MLVSLLFLPRFTPVCQDSFYLFHIFIADSLAAAVTTPEAVQHMLPHRAGRFQPTGPFATTLQLPAELPNPGKALGAEEAPLAGLRVGVRPFNLHGLVSGLHSHWAAYS